jgi:hypothetical protein
MKPTNLFVILIALILGCNQEETPQRGRDPYQEVPDEVIASKPCTTLYKNIMDMFYEHVNNQEVYPQLFSAIALKSIILTKESEAYITFISEGAGFENSLGYYTYSPSDRPEKNADLNLHILFPHVSNSVLTEGDMIQVGTEKFPKGTVLGFFLVMRGWEAGYVNMDKPMHFTDYHFNINQYQQHVLFKEGTCGDIVMAFEDKPLEEGSDYDYNDLIFTVSDNKDQLETVSFDLNNMVQFESPS